MSISWPKILILTTVVGVVVAYYALGLNTRFSFDELRTFGVKFSEFFRSRPLGSAAGYFLFYVSASALSLPLATALTIFGGAIFGFWIGVVLASLASTMGATLAFLLSRFLFSQFVRHRFPGKFLRLDEGFRREGGFYLFALRLVPLFPFFLVNLAMGLTSIKVASFFFISQLGMLPATALYVNAGTRLAELESLKGVLSFEILLSFAALGILPLASKRTVGVLRARRSLARFRKPRSFQYNVVVIGAGAAGLVASLVAALGKAKVALIEKDRMGGDCLNTGCVPSKALIRSSKIMALLKRSNEFGLGDAEFKLDFPKVMERVRDVISRVEPHDSAERYTALGVDCLRGNATIKSPYEIEVGGKTLSTRAIVIATGASPIIPALPGLDDVGYLTSDTLWNLSKLPRRLLVMGGGAIGCELAQAFARFGSEVTIVEMTPTILSREDEDISSFLTTMFAKDRITILTSHKATGFGASNGVKWIDCECPDGNTRIEFDEVLIALGRRAQTKGLGLESLGIELAQNGTIKSDRFLRTNIHNIYVCGDVTGPFQLTHAAAYQAWHASVNSLMSPFKKLKPDYSVLPWCTFTDPEIARVGMNERDAKAAGVEFESTVYAIEELDRAIIEGESHGFVKILTRLGRDRILGVTIACAHAGEMIGEFATAMKNGLGLRDIHATIHAYPTFSEANKFVAGEWKLKRTSTRLLRLAERFHNWRRS